MKFTIYRASEQDMINGCLRGDRAAQKRLYDTYSSKMYALCTRYLKDPMQAQDALVTAFTRIFEKSTNTPAREAWKDGSKSLLSGKP